jgi:hypothetical protein
MPNNTDTQRWAFLSFRAFWFAISWLVSKPWILALLAVGAFANLPQRLIPTVLLRGEVRMLLIPSGRDGFAAIGSHFSEWTNYVYDPISAVGHPPTPFASDGSVLDLSFLFAFAGLCVFRIRHGSAKQACARTFNVAFAATSVMLLLLIAGACYMALARNVPERLRETNWLGLEGNVLLLPLRVAVAATATALFAGAVLGRVCKSDPNSRESYALLHFVPLFLFYGLLVTTLRVIELAPFAILRVFPSSSGSAEAIYETCAVLRAVLPASLLFVPAFIVGERMNPVHAMSRNLTLCRLRPTKVAAAIAIFTFLAFAVQCGVTLALAPVSRSWIVTAGLRQWTELVLHVVLPIATTHLVRNSAVDMRRH